jgi:hypothetical protein
VPAPPHRHCCVARMGGGRSDRSRLGLSQDFGGPKLKTTGRALPVVLEV